MNSQINFNDIFKSNFLENVSAFSLLDMVVALVLSLALGLFIFMVYKKTFRGVIYSENFGVSLVAMTLITTLIILAVTSNIILSLGMVGALSIVRFRSAVKEPLDIAFIFWGISVGIVLGAGLIPLAVFGSIFIGIVLLIFVNKNSYTNPYIIVINCEDNNSEKLIMNNLNKIVKKHVIKSKTVTSSNIELTIEVKLKDASTQFVNDLNTIEGVHSVVLVSYNGDYMN